MHLNRIAPATITLLAVLLAAAACSLADAGNRKLPGSGGCVWWTHNESGFGSAGYINDGIRKACLDGSEVQAIISVPPPFTTAAAWGIAEAVGIAVDAEHGKVYWTTRAWDPAKTPHPPITVYVRRASIDGTQIETLVERPDYVYTDIVLDPVGGRMYWIRNFTKNGHLYSANMNDGSDLQITVPDIDPPTSLAIDLPSRKLYWARSPGLDCIPGMIQRANLDGTEIEDVPIQTTMGPLIIGLAVDSQLGLIFWREGCSESVSKIRRANLDGTGVIDLPLGPVAPISLALDVPNGHLYWANQGSTTGSIRRCDFEGHNMEIVVPLTPARPNRIALQLPSPPSNPFDLNDDGSVNGLDIAILLGQWTGPALYAPCPPHQAADLNQDCKVNGLDLAMLLGAWAP